MKKYLPYFLVILFFAYPAYAQEKNTKEEWQIRLHQKSDFITPEKKETYFSSASVIQLQSEKIGFLLDIKSEFKRDYLRWRPALVYKVSPLFLIGGISTDSLGQDFIQAGILYANSFCGIATSIDVRTYSKTSGTKDTFSECLFETIYPIGKLGIGISGGYSFWWKNDRQDLLIGPIATFKISNNLSIYARYAPAWRWDDDKRTDSKTFRIGIKYLF